MGRVAKLWCACKLGNLVCMGFRHPHRPGHVAQRVQSTHIAECRVSNLRINCYYDLGKYPP